MADLVAPTVLLHRAWLGARDEWGRDVVQHGSGLHEATDVDTPEGFAAWVHRLNTSADESVPAAEGLVHATYWWIVEDGEVVGSITLRHRLTDFLLDAGGHIGYSVRPTARKRGLAAWALGQVLTRARERGLDRVLVTCDDSNEASARTIERNGGVLEDIRDTDLGRTRRYWLATA
ncbi:GNAT family N-acetyltransferase [Catellatospora chokoriensis]|uniref:Acetyltransferase n=1 Tax=Catellatospora chokoriensis TaxID=310353 RepID=A0A8J3NVW4_9ACTN|nr:GNAT family N-acetyltransferase [Catellatospora chokoriensis]GIF94316.1 acetyltransferase [Catellatospora chokoriensis]